MQRTFHKSARRGKTAEDIIGGSEAHLTQGRHIPLSQDAALVVALAGTAMPFAHSAEDEAERWLRALRLHGQVGATLQALGRRRGAADDRG